MSSLLAGFVLSTLTVPQGEVLDREPAFGIVRRADRTPWADAVVRLVSEPFLGADQDVVVTASDAEGRFRARLLVGQPYTAWAWAADGEQWRVTQRVTDAVPRLPIVLDEHHREPRVHLQLRGLAAWDVATATVWCAGDRLGGLAQPFPFGSATRVELPPTGTSKRWLFVQAGNGLDLLQHAVPPTAPAEFQLELPPPRATEVQVLTPDGEPVTGAWLEVRQRFTTVLQPRTDANGGMQVLLPDGTDFAQPLSLHATAPGHLESRWWPRALATGEPLVMHATPAPPVAVHVEWRTGEPIAGVPIWLGGVQQNIEPRPGSRRARANPSFAVHSLLRTDARGEVVLPFTNEHDLSVATALPRDGLAALARRHGGAIQPLVLLHSGSTAATALRLCVEDLRPVRFVFEHHDHLPAPRAHARLGGGASPGLGLDYVADQASSITVLVPPQPDLMLAVWHDGAGEVVKVDVPRAGKGIAVVRVTMPPPIRVTGRVVDSSGNPVAGATVQLGTTLRGERSEWQPVAADKDQQSANPRIVARGYFYPPICEQMFGGEVFTDAEGRFERLLPGRGYPLLFRVALGEAQGEAEWREAESASDVDGEVLLRLR